MTITTRPRSVHRLWIPAIAVGVALAVLGLAFVLDSGSAGQRDVALALGSVALYGLLPLTLVWLAVVAVLRLRRPR